MFLGYSTKDDTILVYDPDNEKMSCGTWRCPECNSTFYGGSKAVHKSGCSRTGYDNLEYRFGDAQIAEAKNLAQRCGDDFAWYGISVALLREKMPCLLD